MGHLISSTAEAQTSCCDRKMTRDFEGVIRDSKLPTTLRQEGMKSKHLTAHQNDNETCLLTRVQHLKVNAVGEFLPWLHIKVAMDTFSSTDCLRPGVASCQAAARYGWSTEYLSDCPNHFHCRHVSGATWNSYQAYRLNLFCTEYGYNEHPVLRTLSMSEQQQPYHPQKNRETTVLAIAQDSGINKTWIKLNIWKIPKASLTCRKTYFSSFSPYQTFLQVWFVRSAANTDISSSLTGKDSFTQHLKFQSGSLWKTAMVIEGILPVVPMIASSVAELVYRSTQTAEVCLRHSFSVPFQLRNSKYLEIKLHIRAALYKMAICLHPCLSCWSNRGILPNPTDILRHILPKWALQSRIL